MLKFLQAQHIVKVNQLSDTCDDLNNKEQSLKIINHLSLLKPLQAQHFDFQNEEQNKDFLTKMQFISLEGASLIQKYRQDKQKKQIYVEHLEKLKAVQKQQDESKEQEGNSCEKALLETIKKLEMSNIEHLNKKQLLETQLEKYSGDQKIAFWAGSKGVVIDYKSNHLVKLKYDNKGNFRLAHAAVYSVVKAGKKESDHTIPGEQINNTKNRRHESIKIALKISRLKTFRQLVEEFTRKQINQSKLKLDSHHLEYLIRRIREILDYYSSSQVTMLVAPLKTHKSCCAKEFLEVLDAFGLAYVQIEKYIHQYYKHGKQYFLKSEKIATDNSIIKKNYKQGRYVTHIQLNQKTALRLKARCSEYYKDYVNYYEKEYENTEEQIATYKENADQLKKLLRIKNRYDQNKKRCQNAITTLASSMKSYQDTLEANPLFKLAQDVINNLGLQNFFLKNFSELFSEYQDEQHNKHKNNTDQKPENTSRKTVKKAQLDWRRYILKSKDNSDASTLEALQQTKETVQQDIKDMESLLAIIRYRINKIKNPKPIGGHDEIEYQDDGGLCNLPIDLGNEINNKNIITEESDHKDDDSEVDAEEVDESDAYEQEEDSEDSSDARGILGLSNAYRSKTLKPKNPTDNFYDQVASDESSDRSDEDGMIRFVIQSKPLSSRQIKPKGPVYKNTYTSHSRYSGGNKYAAIPKSEHIHKGM